MTESDVEGVTMKHIETLDATPFHVFIKPITITTEMETQHSYFDCQSLLLMVNRMENFLVHGKLPAEKNYSLFTTESYSSRS